MARAAGRVLLIGMMGSGKSTIGRALANRTGWPFLDNDALVRQLTGREPKTIDAEDGEDALHAAELAAFRRGVAAPGPAVIAVAGVVVDDDQARRELESAGHVVYLHGRPEILRGRIGSGAGRRADAVDLDWIRSTLREREPRYRAVADQVIDIEDARPKQIASAILDAIASSAAVSTDG